MQRRPLQLRASKFAHMGYDGHVTTYFWPYCVFRATCVECWIKTVPFKWSVKPANSYKNPIINTSCDVCDIFMLLCLAVSTNGTLRNKSKHLLAMHHGGVRTLL